MTEQEYRDCCPECGGVGMFIGSVATPRVEIEAYRCITENCERDTFTA